MHTRIAKRAIFTIEVITRAAIIVVITMVEIAIVASIYEMWGTAH
jgi:hypothetical protein